MDKPKVTPKDFFLWAGAMISLYVSVFSLVSLLFAYIDKTFPDVLSYSYDPYSEGMRFHIASLVVLSPLFLVLMRLIRSDIVKDQTRKDIWVRRWALYLTIFIAGATVAVDLIALINTFLGGEITVRFLLKVLVVFLVASAGLMHFLADIWGYWIQNPNLARRVGWGVGTLVVLTVGSGFLIMGSPNEIRLYRFDDQKVSDLQNIQYQIVNYWQAKQKMPATLAEVSDPINGMIIPNDPQSNQPYRYEITGGTSFNLCATFNAVTQSESPTNPRTTPIVPLAIGEKGDISTSSWYHGAGDVCFERSIDPDRYPSLNQKTAPTVN